MALFELSVVEFKVRGALTDAVTFVEAVAAELIDAVTFVEAVAVELICLFAS